VRDGETWRPVSGVATVPVHSSKSVLEVLEEVS
jgi:hypothetical protein